MVRLGYRADPCAGARGGKGIQQGSSSQGSGGPRAEAAHWRSHMPHRNRPVFISQLCPVIGWEQSMENMALAPTWWWIQSIAAGPGVHFAPSALNECILSVATNTASPFWYFGSFNNLVPRNLKRRVAGRNQPSKCILGQMKMQILLTEENLTLESLRVELG